MLSSFIYLFIHLYNMNYIVGFSLVFPFISVYFYFLLIHFCFSNCISISVFRCFFLHIIHKCLIIRSKKYSYLFYTTVNENICYLYHFFIYFLHFCIIFALYFICIVYKIDLVFLSLHISLRLLIPLFI